MEQEIWGWRDQRSKNRVSVSSTHTKEQADQELEGWWARDRRGKRPDLHDLMPHIEVFRIYPPDERDCRSQNLDTGLVCHVEVDSHGPMHQAWTHYPGQLVVWPVEESNEDTSRA